LLGQRYQPSQPINIFIAALNEEEGIGATILELLQSVNANRILVIDGHSNDRTVEIAKEMGAEIFFQEGKGKGDALAKAVQCMTSDVNYVVITDADFTYPAKFVPEMIQTLKDNPRIGMVCGNRFCNRNRDSAFKSRFTFGNKVLALAHSFFIGVNLKDPLTGLRVVRADILRNWNIKSKGFDIEVELNHQVDRQGFETVEVPIQYRKRLGEKKLKIRDGTTILKRILYESVS
jgi:glycosyltransferase involved in cell wall biosynthesis